MGSYFCDVTLEYNGFYIAGSNVVNVPASLDEYPFAISKECINVGCRMWHDAEIRIELGQYTDFECFTPPIVNTFIRTPTRKVILFDANHPELMKLEVEIGYTRIRVFTNHATEPDHVVVAVGK